MLGTESIVELGVVMVTFFGFSCLVEDLGEVFGGDLSDWGRLGMGDLSD